jgi:hypothetical protein
MQRLGSNQCPFWGSGVIIYPVIIQHPTVFSPMMAKLWEGLHIGNRNTSHQMLGAQGWGWGCPGGLIQT